jgi:hypothetical protein
MKQTAAGERTLDSRTSEIKRIIHSVPIRLCDSSVVFNMFLILLIPDTCVAFSAGAVVASYGLLNQMTNSGLGSTTSINI